MYWSVSWSLRVSYFRGLLASSKQKKYFNIFNSEIFNSIKKIHNPTSEILDLNTINQIKFIPPKF
jgi:hypothetical protein